MSAIEYGSYYWCVLLNSERDGEHGQQTEESIYLHADEISIDAGTLTFKSTGRRPAGTDPKSRPDSSRDGGEGKSKDSSENKEMIYIAFAPGSWKMVYAAKLQDGSPASVEHWNKGQAERSQPGAANAGARGYVPNDAVQSPQPFVASNTEKRSG
jgi:hypothetical protein